MDVETSRYKDTAMLPERFETLTLQEMSPDSVVGVNPERLVVDLSGRCFLDTRAPLEEQRDDANLWVFKFFDGWYLDIHGLNKTFRPIDVGEEHPYGEAYLDPIQAIIHHPEDVLDLAYYYWRRTGQDAYSEEHLKGLISGSFHAERKRRAFIIADFWKQLFRRHRHVGNLPDTDL